MVTDGELVGRCLAGDGKAFEEIVHRHGDAVFRYLLRATRNHDQAEDLCQDTFVRLYGALHRFDRRRPLHPYVMKIAANLCRNGHGPRLQLVGEEEADSVAERGALEQRAVDDVQRQQVLAAMRRLRREYREALSLRYDSGLSYREIAEAMGVSEGVVATWLHRGLAELRGMLKTAEKEAVR
jgi:RNA polymerase sigma-70 factor (ECF subfamily)